MRAHGTRGQALPLVLVALVLAVGAMLVLGRVGRAALDGARARTAADAAALAGAAAGEKEAEALGRLNGAAGTTVDGGVGDATARVRVGGHDAIARAQGPPPLVGTGLEGLTPEMTAALARAGALLGTPVPVTSGFRTYAQQLALWNARHTNPYPVARPGTSRHEQGIAVDVPSSFVPRLLPVAPLAGLCRPLPTSDPVHFELCRRTTGASVGT